MRRLILVLGLLAVAGVALYVVRAEPAWYLQLRYPLEHEALIREEAAVHDLPPSLIAAVIYSESGFDEEAVSPAGAVGLMQLLPATARSIAEQTGERPVRRRELFDPTVNIDLGSWYLDAMRDKYDDHPQALDLALAAYNAGQGNVDRWVRRTPSGERVEIPFPETRAYIQRVHRMQDAYRRGYGLR